MHLPLEVGSKLEAYEITGTLRRLGDHNFYTAVSTDGSAHIINEYIPAYCIRSGDGSVCAENEDNARLLEGALGKLKSNLSLIIDSPLNSKFRIKRIINSYSTAYAVSNSFDGASIAEAIDSGDRRETGYWVDLIIMLCDLVEMSLYESISFTPDKHNVSISKDDFMILYTLAHDGGESQARSLAELLYFVLYGDEYNPVTVSENISESEFPESCFEFMMDTIAERFTGDVSEFRTRLYDLYYPPRAEEAAETEKSSAALLNKLRLGITLAVIIIILLVAGGTLSYFLMSIFYTI